MFKLCYIDLETGGVKIGENPILQLAGIVEINREVVEEFNFFIQPFSGEIVEDRALEVNKISRDDIATFPQPVEVYQKFTRLMGKYVNKYKPEDKFHFVGYNCEKFDSPFLRKWFEKNGDPYYGSWFYEPSIDLMRLWSFFLINERKNLKNFKLITVAKYLGIEVDEAAAHDGLYDIRITKEIFEILLERYNLSEMS